ncbi:ribose 5-phosphate isomerase B [bacterium]|nr:ribose 5-phosphate isomerase B [bacterium]
MKIAIGADHAGYPLKQELVGWLTGKGYELTDLGTNSTDAVDYPDYARAVGQAVIDGKTERGIIVCGSGVGACVAANKIKGIRAGVCHDTFSARQGVEDDDMNVLCMGGRIIGGELAKEIVIAFLNAKFSGLERHRRRKEKVLKIEAEGR